MQKRTMLIVLVVSLVSGCFYRSSGPDRVIVRGGNVHRVH